MQEQEIKNINILEERISELKLEQNLYADKSINAINNIDTNMNQNIHSDIDEHSKYFWYVVTLCFTLLIITLLFINGGAVISRI